MLRFLIIVQINLFCFFFFCCVFVFALPRENKMLRTSLSEVLGVKHAILLAPMAGSADGKLGAAVAKAGGMPILGAAFQSPEWLSRQLGVFSSMAPPSSPFGIGLVVFDLPKRPGLLEAALRADPTLIWLSFGDPSPLLPLIREREEQTGKRILVACQVQTVREAVAVAQQGADIVVAQGEEAGGHGSSRSTTFCLVPQVASALASISPPRKVFLAAAGGVADGRGIAAAFCLGAQGVVMGTRFLATQECSVSSIVKEALVRAQEGDDTLRSRVWDILKGGFWPKEYNGRALRNKIARLKEGKEKEWEEMLEKNPGEWKKVTQEYQSACQEGNRDIMETWSGAGVGLITSVPPVSLLIHSLVQETLPLLPSSSKL